MNISTIIEMLKVDPSIVDDLAAFRQRMNAKNQSVVIERAVVVKEAVTVMRSIAEMNGGPCTVADIQRARDIIRSEPLLEQAHRRFRRLQSEIDAGTVTTEAQATAKFAEPLE